MQIPTGQVFYDDYESRANDFLEKFKGQKEKDPQLLQLAAVEFRKSTNPEGKGIAQLLDGWYWRERGVQEKDNEKACVYFLKSASAFNKDKKMMQEAKRIMLLFYKRKVEVLHQKKKSPAEIFLKAANIHKELGQEKEYHGELTIYFLITATESKNLEQSILSMEESLNHAKQSEDKEMQYKVESILHKLKSHASVTLDYAIHEIQKELELIEKTSDKFGKEGALADLSFLNSQKATEPEMRIKLLEEAATYYEKAGMAERAHMIRGDIYQFRATKIRPQEKEHADLYRKASEEYGKAGNDRMKNLLAGHHEIALASINGVFADDSEEFRKRLMNANHYYKDAGNIGGVQFTAGVGLFLEANRAEYPQSIKLFEVASQCLESVNEHFLAAFAKSEILSQKVSKAKNREEQRALMLEEKNYLEKAIIEDGKKQPKQQIQFPVDGIMVEPKIFDSLNKARFYELSGFLEEDNEVRKKHFQRAKQAYLSLESSGAFSTIVLPGIAWTSLFIEDISDAKKYFEKLSKISPENPHVKSGFEAVDKLIKVKYSKEATEYLIRTRVSQPLAIELGDDIALIKNGKPFPSEFFNLCLAITKDSCSQIERFRHDFFNSSEPALRNQILMLSNNVTGKGLGINFTGESYSGEGKSDILAINPNDNKDYFIGECKIWSSPNGYMKGFNQLVSRYTTKSDKACVLINFVKKGEFSEVVEKAIQAVKKLDPEATVNIVDEKNFVSTHKKHGQVFHHLVDLIKNRET